MDKVRSARDVVADRLRSRPARECPKKLFRADDTSTRRNHAVTQFTCHARPCGHVLQHCTGRRISSSMSGR
eukprot:6490097-Amphidinium_carterae.3